jgi:LacI family transcriptional regulator
MTKLVEAQEVEPVVPGVVPRRITVKDVAQRAGVAHASVCVVLNGARGATRVSDATRTRILQAAEELGYRRNGSAVSMKSGRSGYLSLLMSTDPILSGLHGDLLRGVQIAAEEHQYHLHLERLPAEQMMEEGLWPRVLREWMTDGLLLNYVKPELAQLAELIDRQRIPAIWTNAHRIANCVFPDDEGAFYDATLHLIALGHQRILHVTPGHTIHYSVAARQRGYERAMQEATLQPQVLVFDRERSHAWIHEAAGQVVRRPKASRPTAALAYGPDDAMYLWSAALMHGVRVPEEMSLIAADTAPTVLAGKELSRLSIPFLGVGTMAVKLLLERIRDPACHHAPHAVPFPPLTGDTCVAPS